MLAQAPGSSSWAFKELEGIKKSKLSTDTIAKLKEAIVNRHIDINKKGVTLDGKVMKDEYIDIVHGIDWLHVRIQERLFRRFNCVRLTRHTSLADLRRQNARHRFYFIGEKSKH